MKGREEEANAEAMTERGPSYLGLHRTGELRRRARAAMASLAACELCPRACRVDRLDGGRGVCKAGSDAVIASWNLHRWEEPPISGTRGSGTVFFSGCNLECLFCQNFPISRLGVGKEAGVEELGKRIVDLQAKGAHNVNFVTPTPHVPHLVGAVAEARRLGFTLPVVYNTNGYDSLEALRLLDGVVDVWLPDAKYRAPDLAGEASSAPDYPEANAIALEEMFRMAGPLQTGEDGIAMHGVLVRHLVLPGRVDSTVEVLRFLRERFGPHVPLSLMGQYFPAFRAHGREGYDRRLTAEEYDQAIDAASALGLENVFVQEL
jgi:putative pyruvate formate lyase activating enzyme